MIDEIMIVWLDVLDKIWYHRLFDDNDDDDARKNLFHMTKFFLIQYSAVTPDYFSLVNEDTPFKLLCKLSSLSHTWKVRLNEYVFLHVWPSLNWKCMLIDVIATVLLHWIDWELMFFSISISSSFLILFFFSHSIFPYYWMFLLLSLILI